MPAYQPDDVNDILRRAAELQARTQGTPDVGGLTPDDLATLGKEIGIDPAFVAEALRQRARGGAPPVAPGGGLFGGPGRVSAERTLPAPLTDRLWSEIVDEMRAVSGEKGDTATVGDTREWRYQLAMGGTVRAFASATPTSGGTRVRAEHRTADAGVIAIALPVMIALMVALFASMGYGLTGLGLGAILVAVTFLVGRFAYGRHTRRAWTDLQKTLDRLELAALRESVPSAASARIALPTEDAPDAVAGVRGGTRTSA